MTSLRPVTPPAAPPPPGDGFLSWMLDAAPGGTLWRADGAHPTVVRAWGEGELDLPDGGTHHLFVLRGIASLRAGAGGFTLGPGMYGAVPGAATVGADWAGARGLVISAVGFGGLFLVGGPIERAGRLRYIDGCTDTLLIHPPRLGDPCLNLLHIPRGTRQTAHTHPSLRAGVIASGRGRCVTPHAEHPLTPGLAFVILPDARHSFVTDGPGEDDLRVIAYHPDSDTGPTDEDHPMINRTIIGGSPVADAPGGSR